MAFVKAGIVALVAMGMAALLAYLARRAQRSWPVTGSLLLGSIDMGNVRVDLRFTAVVTAVVSSMGTVLAFPSLLRAVSATEAAIVLVLTLPLVAVVLAVTADVFLRLAPARWRAAPQANHALSELLNTARGEVATALEQVEDPSRVAALHALTEAVSEYDSALDRNGETAKHLRKTIQERVRGVIELARSCTEEERREASQLLGVRLEATADEVEAVYRSLSAIYEGPGALPGVDPMRSLELRAAMNRLRARPTSQAA